MRALHPVQVHVPEEAGNRLKLMQSLADEHAVGAEIDVAVPLYSIYAYANV